MKQYFHSCSPFCDAAHLNPACVCVSGSMMEYDTENMNSEEIYSSLRGVTEAIQSFSYRSQEDLNEPIRPEGKRDDAVGHFYRTDGKPLIYYISCPYRGEKYI